MVESNGLPFDDMLENRVLEYAERNSNEVMKSKSIYYKKKEDFKAYLTFRCINNRSSLDKPEIEHMCSDEFSLESWKENE